MADRQKRTVCQRRAEIYASAERKSFNNPSAGRLLVAERMRVLSYHNHASRNIQQEMWPGNLIGLMYCRQPFTHAYAAHLAEALWHPHPPAGTIVAFAPLHGHTAAKEFSSSEGERPIPISDIVGGGHADVLYSRPYCRACLPAQWDKVAVALGPMVRPVRSDAEEHMAYQEELKYMLHVAIHVRPYVILPDSSDGHWGLCLSRCLLSLGVPDWRASTPELTPELTTAMVHKYARGSILNSAALRDKGLGVVHWAALGTRPEYVLGSNGETFANYVAPRIQNDAQHGIMRLLVWCARGRVLDIEDSIKEAYVSGRATSIADIVRRVHKRYRKKKGDVYVTKIVAWSPVTHRSIEDIDPEHGAVIYVEAVVCHHQQVRAAVSLGPHFEKCDRYWW